MDCPVCTLPNPPKTLYAMALKYNVEPADAERYWTIAKHTCRGRKRGPYYQCVMGVTKTIMKHKNSKSRSNPLDFAESRKYLGWSTRHGIRGSNKLGTIEGIEDMIAAESIAAVVEDAVTKGTDYTGIVKDKADLVRDIAFKDLSKGREIYDKALRDKYTRAYMSNPMLLSINPHHKDYGISIGRAIKDDEKVWLIAFKSAKTLSPEYSTIIHVEEKIDGPFSDGIKQIKQIYKKLENAGYKFGFTVHSSVGLTKEDAISSALEGRKETIRAAMGYKHRYDNLSPSERRETLRIERLEDRYERNPMLLSINPPDIYVCDNKDCVLYGRKYQISSKDPVCDHCKYEMKRITHTQKNSLPINKYAVVFIRGVPTFAIKYDNHQQWLKEFHEDGIISKILPIDQMSKITNIVHVEAVTEHGAKGEAIKKLGSLPRSRHPGYKDNPLSAKSVARLEDIKTIMSEKSDRATKAGYKDIGLYFGGRSSGINTALDINKEEYSSNPLTIEERRELVRQSNIFRHDSDYAKPRGQKKHYFRGLSHAYRNIARDYSEEQTAKRKEYESREEFTNNPLDPKSLDPEYLDPKNIGYAIKIIKPDKRGGWTGIVGLSGGGDAIFSTREEALENIKRNYRGKAIVISADPKDVADHRKRFYQYEEKLTKRFGYNNNPRGLPNSWTSQDGRIRLSLVKDYDLQQWVIKVYKDGKYNEAATNYTDSKEDAIGTFEAMKRGYSSGWKNNPLTIEEQKEALSLSDKYDSWGDEYPQRSKEYSHYHGRSSGVKDIAAHGTKYSPQYTRNPAKSLKSISNVPGFDQSVKNYIDFNGKNPTKVTRFLIPDGNKGITSSTVWAGMGHAPAAQYKILSGSAKKKYGTYFQHDYKKMPLVAMDPSGKFTAHFPLSSKTKISMLPTDDVSWMRGN